MIFRLEYCNKFGDAVRVDITTPGLPTVVEVEGAGDPFRLKYTPDVNDKSFRFLTTSAEINIYETPEFNIDNLKTSSETDIKVDYYINGVKDWIGFVLPDFFSKEIRGNAVVSMTASDRISTLKGVTLSDLPAFISIRELCIQCLAKTGLDLPLNTMVDFLASQVGFNDYFRSEILSQRLADNKGRSISCYDVLNSILVTSNSFLEQRNGEWYIINKLQHELGEGELYSSPNTHTTYSEVTHNFSEITRGAMRTIIPVAASVGVFHEHGGGKLHPDNYDFSKDLTGWNPVGGFTGLIDNRRVSEYTTGGTGQAEYLPKYGEPTQTNYLVNNNQYVRNDNPIYLESNDIDIPYTGSGAINVEVDINATGPAVYPNFAGAYIRAAVVAVSGSEVLTLDHSGKFIKMPSINPPVFEKEIERGFPYGDSGNLYKALSPGMRISGTLEASDLSAYKLRLRIYGGGGGRAVLFNSVSISMKSSSDVPKGNLYKREQGSNFTKTHEIETSIFGDYITGGLNGYFYDYPIDDTSSLYSPNGNLRERWIDPTDPNGEELPLLQHVVRQKARMFSVAHDKISGEIEMVNFDPLAIFVDCSGKRYSLVSAEVDFLRSVANIEIEEIAYQNLTVRDYIYSYFGEGESNIKSVGGIASGSGGGTGGGLTPEQLEILSFWKKDPDRENTIFTEMNAYSKLELSAYGAGDGGSGGGGSDYERLDTWASYDSSKSGWVLSAFLGNDLNTRVTAIDGRLTDLENTAGSGSVTSVGISVPTGLSVSNSPITSSGVISIGLQAGYSIPTTAKQGQWDTAVDKVNEIGVYNYTTSVSGTVHTVLLMPNGSSVSLTAPSTQYIYDINLQTFPTGTVTGARQVVYYDGTWKVFDVGVVPKTSNHPYIEIIEGLPKVRTNHANTYPVALEIRRHFAPNSNINVMRYMGLDYVAEHTHTFASLTSKPTTLEGYGITDAYTKTEVNSALNLKLDKSVFDDLFEKVEVSTGVFAIKAKYDFYSIGEVSAYGFGTGGSGGGSYDRLDAWADYDSTKSGWVLSALLGNELNTRVGNLEGGSALTVNTTGTGNAITSLTKSGTVITATKGATFSLDNHLHTGVYEPVFTKNTAFNKNFGTTSGTVAQGNDSRIINGQTAYSWGNHSSAGYVPSTRTITAGNGLTGGGALAADRIITLGTPGTLSNSTTNSVTATSHTHSIDPSNFSVLSAGVVRVSSSFDVNDATVDTLKFKVYDSYNVVGTPYAYGNILEVNGITNHWKPQLWFDGGAGGKIRYRNRNFNATSFGDWRILAFTTDNVASATKLQTPRTIWGQSFDGTGNVSGALSGATTGSFTGAVTVNTLNISSTAAASHIAFSRPSYNYITTPLDGGLSFVTNGDSTSALNSMMILSPNGNVGVGKGFSNNTTAITAQLHVRGDILATGTTTTTKVIFNAAGWSMEQVGSELQMKHNNVLKMRFTSTGSIIATEEITAFG